MSLVRDRVTWLHYAQQGAFGYFQFGFGPSVLLLREESGASMTVAGLYGPATAVGAIVGGALFPRLTRRLSLRLVLAIALAGLACGVALFCLMPSVAGTLAAATLTMSFGILILSGVSTGLSEHHGAAASGAVSESNAASAGMGFVAPLLLNVAMDAGLGWRAAMGLSIVFAATLAVVTVVNRGRQATIPTQRTSDAPARPEDGRLPRRYWLAWTCLLTVMSVETALMQWAPEQLRERTGLAAGAAAVGVSALLGGMVAGRLAGGWVALRVGTIPLLYATLAMAAVGFTVFWTATDPEVAIAGLIFCGLGIALHFPLGITLTIRTSGQRSALAMSRSAFAAALGFGAAPFLLGALADQLGINWAFALVPTCLIIAALVLTQLVRLERRDRSTVEPAVPHRVTTRPEPLTKIPETSSR